MQGRDRRTARRRARPRRPAALLAACAALACCACGATPPQVPVEKADRVASALAGITEACGLARQLDYFHPRHPGMAALEAQAAMRARELADAFRGNAERIYQGRTMAQVAGLAVDYLRECGFARQARALRADTHG